MFIVFDPEILLEYYKEENERLRREVELLKEELKQAQRELAATKMELEKRTPRLTVLVDGNLNVIGLREK